MTTYIKISDNTDSDVLFRCDLARAESPLQYWNDDQWVSTQYQCADCRHSRDGMAEIAKQLMAEWCGLPLDEYERECDFDWELINGFNPDPNTEHETAKDFFSGYGWHLTTEHAGDVCHDAVDFDWLDDDNDTVIEKLLADDDDLLRHEAEAIVVRAREIREAGEAIEAILNDAVEAFERGDFAACVAALDAAESLEMEHGDCSASSALRAELIDGEWLNAMKS